MEIRSVALLTWTRFMFYFCSTDAKRYFNFLFKDRFSMCVFVWVCVCQMRDMQEHSRSPWNIFQWSSVSSEKWLGVTWKKHWLSPQSWTEMAWQQSGKWAVMWDRQHSSPSLVMACIIVQNKSSGMEAAKHNLHIFTILPSMQFPYITNIYYI